MIVKFKVLQYNQDFMAKLGLHSHRLNESTNEFFKSPAAFLILFTLGVFSITSTGVYAYKNIGHFEAALQGIFVAIAGIQCGGMYVSVGLKMDKIKDVQSKLQNMVDDGIFYIKNIDGRSMLFHFISSLQFKRVKY